VRLLGRRWRRSGALAGDDGRGRRGADVDEERAGVRRAGEQQELRLGVRRRGRQREQRDDVLLPDACVLFMAEVRVGKEVRGWPVRLEEARLALTSARRRST
jgi:hypothetical protein